MTIPELEEVAAKAKRKVDIAKHTPIPLAELDTYGDESHKGACYAQPELMKLALELQNAYAKELGALWQAIDKLRVEALYWRQKYDDLREKTGME